MEITVDSILSELDARINYLSKLMEELRERNESDLYRLAANRRMELTDMAEWIRAQVERGVANVSH